MNDENAILAYYQGLRDKSIVAGKWIHLLYERILDGIEDHYDDRCHEPDDRLDEVFHLFPERGLQISAQRLLLRSFDRGNDPVNDEPDDHHRAHREYAVSIAVRIRHPVNGEGKAEGQDPEENA